MLDKILRAKRAEVARMSASPRLPIRHEPAGGFFAALRRPVGAPLRLVAEIKLRSPSAGELSRALSPVDRALVYARSGASAISVLTDPTFFDGSFEHLFAIRDALDAALGSSRPRLLAKEFVIDPIQLHRAADAGADAVLLIARIVSPEQLVTLAEATRELGLEPLVEVATHEELAAARAARARVVGVNARDLDTLRMNAELAGEVLAALTTTHARPDLVAMRLSGLSTPDDVAAIAATNVDAALIGESLMRLDDPAPLLAAMISVASSARV
jgi:indole-3-glycerol phosphate synthase